MGDMDGMMSGMGAWMAIWLALVAVLVVAGAVLINHAVRSRRAVTSPDDGPRAILQRRYASGEISEDEFFRRMSGLDQS